jgi:hypothetical protein
MTPPRPISGADDLRPPALPAVLDDLFKVNEGMSKNVFQIACLAGDTAAASIAAWHFVQMSEGDTRDAVLQFVIEGIGFSNVELVDRMRRIWGAVRPQGPWAPPLEWPDIVETIQILITAPTGTVATDLLAYSIYPFERPSRINAMWDSSLEARAQVLADTTKPLVTRLAAALAMTEGIDPRWSHREEAEGGSAGLLTSTLTALATPAPLIDGIEYAIRGESSFPALAHALVHGELTAVSTTPRPVILDQSFPKLIEIIQAAWTAPAENGSAWLPTVLGLPLHAFHWRTDIGLPAIQIALKSDPDLVSRLGELSPADPAEVVDTVIARATRRLATRDVPVPSIPFAAELGDLGLFCRVGVAPHEVATVIGLVRPILPAVAKAIVGRLVVLH